MQPSLASSPTLPDTLALGAVHLTVADLDRSVAWYQRALGLRVHHHEAVDAELGDGTRTAIEGASDHGTHEAIYLPDPDGNGIELAADRPREQWPAPEEEFSGGPRPLDLASLLATVEGEAPAPQVGPGLRVGHLHLHVGDVDAGLAFYRDVLGLQPRALLPTAAFLAAGGYHHHIGLNVGRGRGVGHVPGHTIGLRHWTIELADPEEVATVRERFATAQIPTEDEAHGFRVRDPWGIALRVAS